MTGKVSMEHSIHTVFVYFLLGVFAVSAMLIVLLGAQTYKEMADRADQHTQDRILRSFLRSTIEAQDDENAVSVAEYDGLCVLELSTDVDDEIYVTSVFCTDGKLRQRLAKKDRDFDPEGGEEICAAQDFQAEIKNNMLYAYLTDPEGNTATVCIALSSGGAK